MQADTSISREHDHGYDATELKLFEVCFCFNFIHRNNNFAIHVAFILTGIHEPAIKMLRILRMSNFYHYTA